MQSIAYTWEFAAHHKQQFTQAQATASLSNMRALVNLVARLWQKHQFNTLKGLWARTGWEMLYGRPVSKDGLAGAVQQKSPHCSTYLLFTADFRFLFPHISSGNCPKYRCHL